MPEEKFPNKDQHYIKGLKDNDETIIKEIYDKFYVHVARFIAKNSGSEFKSIALFKKALISISDRLQVKDIILKIPFDAYFYQIYRSIWLRRLNEIERKSIVDLEEFKEYIEPIHEDQLYVDGLEDRDNLIIKEIYDKFYPKIEWFVLNNSGTKEQAEDLFQEVLTDLWEKVKVDQIVLIVPFGGYIYPRCRFKWLNYLNRDPHRKNVASSIEINDLEEYKDFVVNYFGDDLENLEERRLAIFNDCLKQLNENCRKMFKLRFEGKKSKEIAEIMDRASSDAVNVAMFGCRRRLEDCIKNNPEYNRLKV